MTCAVCDQVLGADGSEQWPYCGACTPVITRIAAEQVAQTDAEPELSTVLAEWTAESLALVQTPDGPHWIERLKVMER